MGAFATVKFLTLAFALLAGLSVYLFTQLRKERSHATLTLNSLSESKARSLDALKAVILDLREDNAALFNSAKTQEEIIESASGVFKRHVDQLRRRDKTIADLEAARMFALDSTEERINSIRDDLKKVHAMAQQLASKRAHGLPDLSLLEDLAELATTTRQDAKGLRGSLRQIRHQSQG